ncbi:MAG TPA: hypothetical protein VFB96_07640, partial [Pirellulaceae bacterium]|nr:hypothetical protein [Pirellulaceae bacterium]
DLSYTYVTHEALKSLARLPQLQTLNVTGAPLSRLDAPQVRQLFSRCHVEGLPAEEAISISVR